MSPILTTMLQSLLLGLTAGAIMHRSDFCMTAAFPDFFLFRSTTLLAALLRLLTRWVFPEKHQGDEVNE